MVVKRFIRPGATKEKRHMTAPAIQKYLSRRLELERHGGTIFARDEHTLILADTGKFTSSHAALLQTVFPHVTFSVVPCDSSTSGFIVIFCCSPTGERAWQRSALRLALHIACLLLCAFSVLH
jgi:hypothetical protein